MLRLSLHDSLEQRRNILRLYPGQIFFTNANRFLSCAPIL